MFNESRFADCSLLHGVAAVVLFYACVAFATDDSPAGNRRATARMTYVAPYGSHEDLKGRVENVNTNEHAVAVYIRVNGGWWTKPYWDYPRTSIREDGSWMCDITTGGIDHLASEITAFVLSKDIAPPLMSGGGRLPSMLYCKSVVHAHVKRDR